MKITCPYCHYSGNISEKLVPEEGRIVGCPTCKRKFKILKTDDPRIGVSFPIGEANRETRTEAEPEMVIERNVVPGFEDTSPGSESKRETPSPRFTPPPAASRNYVKVSVLILVSYLVPSFLAFIMAIASIASPGLVAFVGIVPILGFIVFLVCFVLVGVFLGEASKNQRATGLPQKGKGCLIALLIYFSLTLVASIIYLLFSAAIS